MTPSRDKDQSLAKARRIAADVADDVSVSTIEQMSRSSNTESRIAAAIVLQKRAEELGSVLPFLGTLQRLIEDPPSRWQALIAIAESVESDPDAVWNVISRYGGSHDDDMQAGIACVLLEHLLDEHFEEYFPRVRERALEDTLFCQTLALCRIEEAGRKQRRVKSLLRTALRGRHVR